MYNAFLSLKALSAIGTLNSFSTMPFVQNDSLCPPPLSVDYAGDWWRRLDEDRTDQFWELRLWHWWRSRLLERRDLFSPPQTGTTEQKWRLAPRNEILIGFSSTLPVARSALAVFRQQLEQMNVLAKVKLSWSSFGYCALTVSNNEVIYWTHANNGFHGNFSFGPLEPYCIFTLKSIYIYIYSKRRTISCTIVQICVAPLVCQRNKNPEEGPRPKIREK